MSRIAQGQGPSSGCFHLAEINHDILFMTNLKCKMLQQMMAPITCCERATSTYRYSGYFVSSTAFTFHPIEHNPCSRFQLPTSTSAPSPIPVHGFDVQCFLYCLLHTGPSSPYEQNRCSQLATRNRQSNLQRPHAVVRFRIIFTLHPSPSNKSTHKRPNFCQLGSKVEGRIPSTSHFTLSP